MRLWLVGCVQSLVIAEAGVQPRSAIQELAGRHGAGVKGRRESLRTVSTFAQKVCWPLRKVEQQWKGHLAGAHEQEKVAEAFTALTWN